MESLMRWRLMPTFASRTAIPEPFRPTPLQYSTINYPVTIDFINWYLRACSTDLLPRANARQQAFYT